MVVLRLRRSDLNIFRSMAESMARASVTIFQVDQRRHLRRGSVLVCPNVECVSTGFGSVNSAAAGACDGVFCETRVDCLIRIQEDLVNLEGTVWVLGKLTTLNKNPLYTAPSWRHESGHHRPSRRPYARGLRQHRLFEQEDLVPGTPERDGPIRIRKFDLEVSLRRPIGGRPSPNDG